MSLETPEHSKAISDISDIKVKFSRNDATRRLASILYQLISLIQDSFHMAGERYRSLSLRFKIALFVVILLTGTSFILYLITVQIMNNYLLNEIIKRGESVGKSVAASAGYSLLSRDLLSLDNLVFKAKASNSDMEYIAFVTPERKIIVHSDMTLAGKTLSIPEGKVVRKSADGTMVIEAAGSTGFFDLSCPVIFMNKQVGNVRLAINRSVILQAQAKVHSRIIVVFSIILILGTLASVLLASFIVKPIKALTVGVSMLKEGISRSPLKIHSDDELGKLTINFNEMSSTIAEQQSKLNKYAQDLEDAYVSIVRVVASAIDAKDEYTQGHSARVSKLSIMLGEAIGLPQQDLKDLEMACLFHDVGKIRIPDSILLKPAGLTKEERMVMMQHVEYGASILDKAPSLRKYVPAVRHHHERHDGKGYPDGLTGDKIPQLASIISIADTYDAMTSTRPYRLAFSEEEALRELVRVAGQQLRADLVAVFVGLIQKKNAKLTHLSLVG